MTPIRKAIGLTILLLVTCQPTTYAATGTLMPVPYQTIFSTAGAPVSGAKVCVYTAGTSTPTTTYSDVSLATPNTNPIVADSAGRIGPVYLTPGSSYKFIFQDATGTANTCDGAVIRTVDNVAAVPASAANIELTGTAGETLTAGQVVYLSDGSGAKAAGSWYKADSGQSYSSTLPMIGMVPVSITSGQVGTIRLGGQMTGLSVTAGLTYYVGASGALTSTAPVSARIVGVADSATTLVFPKTPIPTQAWVNDFRLTLTTATPVTTSDVSAATTLFCTPFLGNRIDLPDTAGNPQRVTSAEFSIAVPATTSTMYDVFAYLNGSVATLELLAWTNDTTRATAVTRTNGRLTKSGDATRLYIGSFRTTTVSGQTEDSAAKRYVWNYYNRVDRLLQKFEGSSSWAYTTATIRQANASATNQVEAVVGQAEDALEMVVATMVINTTTAAVQIGIGVDSTTTFSASNQGGYMREASGSGTFSVPIQAWYRAVPTVGKHTYSWNEYSEAAGATTWNSNTSSASTPNSGIQGRVKG